VVEKNPKSAFDLDAHHGWKTMGEELVDLLERSP